MKYGIAQWCFPGGGLYAVRFAAEAGYEGLQVETGLSSNGYYMYNKAMQYAYLEDCKRYDIKLISVVDNEIMHVGIQGNQDEGEYKTALKALDMTIETAVGLGCGKIMVPLLFQSQIHPNNPKTFERAVEVMQYACRRAADVGVLVQVETSIPAKMQLDFLRAIGASNLTNYYDFQNLYWYDGLNALQELPELMPVNGDEMHLCDGWGTLASGGPNGGALLGEGETHFESQMKIISGFGWDGWLIAENGYYLHSFKDKGDPYALAKKDLATMKAAVQKHSMRS